jgi:hypothetical protein
MLCSEEKHRVKEWDRSKGVHVETLTGAVRRPSGLCGVRIEVFVYIRKLSVHIGTVQIEDLL